MKARPHCRRNAIPKAMKRMLPTPLAASVRFRPRCTITATHVTYATAEAAMNQSNTVPFRVIPVSTSNAKAARIAPMAVLPLLPMCRM